jgi:hypothetical protein
MQYAAFALALVLASACYSPQYRDCQFSCTTNQCPAGLECTEGVCRLPGMSGACEEPPMLDAAADADLGGPIPLELLTRRQIEALCSRNVRCGVSDDQQSCEAIYSNFLTVRLADLQAAVTVGTLVYHPDRAATCVANVTALACDRDSASRRGLGIDCATIFDGAVTDGAACTMNEECVSQSCSIDPTCTAACCTGTCAGSSPPMLRDLNDICTPTDICTTGYCSTFSMRCTSPLADNDPCSTSDQCKPSSTCRQVAGGTPVCQPLVQTLGPCGTTIDCKSLAEVCGSGKCAAGGLTGATCDATTPCQEQHPCSSGMCAAPPTLNEPCSQFTSCQVGYCNFSVGTCQAKKDDGIACDMALSGRDCTSGFCDTTQPIPKCAARPVCI